MTAEREPSGPAICARVLLGQRLHDWRKSRKLPLKQVADQFGVSEATWSRWEKGTRFPVPENLRRLAEFIGAPICNFFYADRQDVARCPARDGRQQP
jgi:transcriptional regulator with XRE-family HTH domain